MDGSKFESEDVPKPEEEMPIDIEALQKGIESLIELVKTKEIYKGILEEEQVADLTDAIRNVNIQDTHASEEVLDKEFDLAEQENIIGDLWGLLDEYGLPPEEILREAGLME